MGLNTYNYQIPLTNHTMNTTITSPAMQLKNMVGYTIQIVFTGTPTGSFKLQASADPYNQAAPTQPYPEPNNWTDVASSTFVVAAAGNVEWNTYYAMYNYVRFVYTDGSSGSSTATITSSVFNGKGA